MPVASRKLNARKTPVKNTGSKTSKPSAKVSPKGSEKEVSLTQRMTTPRKGKLSHIEFAVRDIIDVKEYDDNTKYGVVIGDVTYTWWATYEKGSWQDLFEELPRGRARFRSHTEAYKPRRGATVENEMVLTCPAVQRDK